jgi:uncharacterized phage protein (TIGR01671 family)
MGIFKMRAWDKKDNKMLYFQTGQYGYSAHLAWWQSAKITKPALYKNSVLQPSETYETMLGIEIKGIVIFIGDIVTGQQLGHMGESMDDYNGQVLFKDGCFAVLYDKEKDYWDLLCNFEKLKVLGNIYENPELLEVQHG